MLELSDIKPSDINYVPSPISVNYSRIYSVQINKSGRLQYFKKLKSENRLRITKSEFSKAYNSSTIVAIKPVQNPGDQQHFLLEFYTV
ncbi:hypothetical protein ACFLU5_13565 [Bacteroidota bacterium]